MRRKALITGITGQDGSYLAEFLLGKDYEVHGIVRRTSTLNRSRLSHIYADPEIYNQRLFLHYADLDDATTLRRVLAKVQPSEIYHLAGQSHVGLSFEIPESTCEMTVNATLRLLEIVRDLPEGTHFFHASSSEVFGDPVQVPQDEETPFNPVNPYGCAKAFATQMVRIYRKSFGLFASNGITYNHESPRRGENFVTRKICRAAAAIKLGLESELMLGDLTARRDWGDARDYVRGMWLTLQYETPEDFVFATGTLHTVQDIVEHAFQTVELDWRAHVRHDERFQRLAEPHRFVGNPAQRQPTPGPRLRPARRISLLRHGPGHRPRTSPGEAPARRNDPRHRSMRPFARRLRHRRRLFTDESPLVAGARMYAVSSRSFHSGRRRN